MSGKFDFINCSKYRAACEQGSTFTKVLYLKNKDHTLMELTGFSASMNVRNKAVDSETIFNLSSSGGELVIDTVESTITIIISANVTREAIIGKHVYDLEITSGGVVTRLIEGTFEITPEVTR